MTQPSPESSLPSGDKKEADRQSQTEHDEGVMLQDTSAELEEPHVQSPPPTKERRERSLNVSEAAKFIAPIAQSFEAFYQKQKSLPPTGRSTPKSRPQSHGRGGGRSRTAGSNKSKNTRPVREKDGKKKDMDLDSVLDFDTKRIGEPDGAESGVVMDMEGSLPVFSDSGDLTPEPTRITPRGKINKVKKPKPTPRGMAL